MKKLEQPLGLVSVVAISLSAMLGSGLFVLPGLAAGMTGTSVWLAYLLAALCVLPAALSKSEMATAMPFSGGTYVYLERSFGPLVGTISGLGLWASFMLKSSFALVGFSAYLEVLTDGPTMDIRVMAEILLLGILCLNIIGVRAISKIQIGVVLTSLIGLACLAAWGLTTRDPELTRTTFTEGPMGLVSATGFVFVAYAGVTKVAAIAEEVKNPGRNLPMGILLALLLSCTIYSSVVFVLVSNVPVSELANDLRPIHTFAERIAGSGVGKAAAALAVVTMISMSLAGMLASSRFPFAMGRDGILPHSQSEVHPRFGTPVHAIILTACAMALAIWFLDVKKIAKLASGFKIMIFIALNVAVILLREANAQWYKPKFKSPLYPFTQVAGILLGLGLIAAMGATALIGAGILMAIGTLFFFGYGRRHATHLGLIQRLGSRKDLLPPSGMAGADTGIIEVDLPAAEVAIPVFGWEVSADELVKIGASLGEEDGKIEVLRITEVANHTSLGEAAEEGEDAVRALELRIKRLARETDRRVRFDSIWTRDLRQSVHGYAMRSDCKWLVMEYIPQDRRGSLLRDPLAWLLNHLPCNLALFKDAGAPQGRRIMISIEPGPHDSLVVKTAAQLARASQTELTFYRALPEQAHAWEVEAVVDYHEQLGLLVDVPSESIVVRHSRPISALIQATADYDLLVTGAPPERGIWGMFLGSQQDRVLDESVCSVLRLKTPRKESHAPVPLPQSKKHDLLLDRIRPELVATSLQAQNKKILFRQLSELFSTADPRHGSTAEIEAALWRRERMQNTAIGDGIAIPHATLAGTPETSLAVAILAEDLDYQAPGAQPVSLVFATIGPPSDRSTHLQLIASLSGLLLKTSLREDLVRAASPDQIQAAFRSAAAQAESQPS